MVTENETLYFVSPINVGAVHLPRATHIPKHERRLNIIPLSNTPEGAIMVAYPNLGDNWTKRVFMLWEIEPKPRHAIVTPSLLKKMWEVEYAKELNLYACFRSLRMEKVGKITIVNKPEDFEIITVEGGEEEITLGRLIPVKI